MTREHAQREREAFNAFCDGRKIQVDAGGVWVDSASPDFSDYFEHRVKPAPTFEERVRECMDKYGFTEEEKALVFPKPSVLMGEPKDMDLTAKGAVKSFEELRRNVGEALVLKRVEATAGTNVGSNLLLRVLITRWRDARGASCCRRVYAHCAQELEDALGKEP